MHSKEQMRKKDEARKESVDHFKNADIMHERGGMSHDQHKMGDMRRGSPDMGDMGSADKFNPGY
jgi:hypothetical protein